MFKTTEKLITSLTLWLVLTFFSGMLKAQDPGTTNVPGNTTVYTSTSTTGYGYSAAYIDASVFYYYYHNQPGIDICSIVNKILTNQFRIHLEFPTPVPAQSSTLAAYSMSR